MAAQLTDPLSFFATGDYSSSSDEEEKEQDGGRGAAKRRKQDETGTKGAEAEAWPPRPSAARLPPPEQLLGRRETEPGFLRNPFREHIDWEKRAVKGPEEPPREFKPWLTNAAPPPSTCAGGGRGVKKAPQGGPDLAVRWSQMYRDEESNPACTRTDGYDDVVISTRGGGGDDDDDEEESLSSKCRLPSSTLPNDSPTESFQEKEKRKRDRGQANRDKSFVEEEKRILRQKFKE